jgi:hypothetical protein
MSGRKWICAAIIVIGCNSSGDAKRVEPTSSSTRMVAASTTASTTASTVVPTVDTPSWSPALVRTPWIDTKQVMDTSLDAPNFQCAPKEFTNNDTITLRAEVPHGGQLLVQAPDSTDFYLIFPAGSEPGSSSLMPADTFENTLITRFRADIRGRPATYGRDTLEPIFRKPGPYTFSLASNLGTDFDTEEEMELATWRCTITLRSDR